MPIRLVAVAAAAAAAVAAEIPLRLSPLLGTHVLEDLVVQLQVLPGRHAGCQTTAHYMRQVSGRLQAAC